MSTCVKCGQQLSYNAMFCSECGTAVEDGCRKCGHPLEDGAQFCTECGSTINSAAPPSHPRGGSAARATRDQGVVELPQSTSTASSRPATEPAQINDTKATHKLLIVVSILFVLVIGVVIIRVARQSHTTSQTDATPTSSSTPVPQSAQASVPMTHAVTTTTEPTTSTKYTVNHVVKWNDGTTDTTKTFETIPNAKVLVLDDDGNPANYGYAYEDLKGDGNKQLIIQGNGTTWCGTAGCMTIILEQRNGEWAQLFSANIGDGFAIMNEKINGYAVVRGTSGEGMSMTDALFAMDLSSRRYHAIDIRH
jgi:Double zinc ribbon